MNGLSSAYRDGYRAALKLADLEDTSMMSPDDRPFADNRRMSDINQAFQMNADFGTDPSQMTQPGALNPSLNPTVGPGPFANKTDTMGGLVS